ncbi:hypothetical protein Peur_015249 [Populus x canadensis]
MCPCTDLMPFHPQNLKFISKQLNFPKIYLLLPPSSVNNTTADRWRSLFQTVLISSLLPIILFAAAPRPC